jgi:phosphoribosylglycinamide formyltransferase 2
MLLGSGELGKEVIISLQRLGIEVIAVDRYANAPGHQVAHRAHVIDMTDGDALAALIEREQPDLVVPEIEAIATRQAGRAGSGRQDHLHPDRARHPADHEPRRHPPPGRRRTGPGDLALPLRQQPGRTEQACAEIGFPNVVKPVMSSSGKGQSKLDSAPMSRTPGTTRPPAGAWTPAA